MITMTTKERILVTGGAGFIGSHTIALLLDRGKEVVVLDNLLSGRLTRLPLTHSKLTFVEGDILDYPLVAKLMHGCDAVLHLAAMASVSFSITHPLEAYQTNAYGFMHVLEAIRQADHPVRLVYASSAAVYGDAAHLPCVEEDASACLPLSPYALHKVDNEQQAKLYTRLHGIEALGLRYFNVYGPGQDPASLYSGVISRFLADHSHEVPLTIWGDGTQARDFIYVTDIALANLLALESSYSGVLNIATGQPETIFDLIQYIAHASERAPVCDCQPKRSFDIHLSYAAIDLAWQKIGFKAMVSLEKGVEVMVQQRD